MSKEPTRWWVRGAIWIGIGALAYVIGLVADYRLVVRGTNWPWAFVVAGVGLLLLAWDAWRARKPRAAATPPEDEKKDA